MSAKILLYAMNRNQRNHLNELLYSSGRMVRHTDSLSEAFDLVAAEHDFEILVTAAAPAYAETIIRQAQLPALVIGRMLEGRMNIVKPVIHLNDDSSDQLITQAIAELLGEQPILPEE